MGGRSFAQFFSITWVFKLIALSGFPELMLQCRQIRYFHKKLEHHGGNQQALARCGKEGCKCAEGELHGPYWYGYYRSARIGRVVKKYIGKEKKELRPR